MPNATITPATGLRGTLAVPGDKSIAHRALICGALANGWTRLIGIPRSADVSATIRALNTCGVQTQRNEDALIVQGAGFTGWQTDRTTIDCANSGTTMRLLMGVLSGMPGAVRLVGDDSLSKRPMSRAAKPLRMMGADIRLERDDNAPIEIRGTRELTGIDYELSQPSAQIKTALLLAGLAANGDTRLRGRLDSRDHTERILPLFGAALERRNGEIAIEGGQRMRGVFVEIPGDPSSAAYWIAAAAIAPSSKIEIHNVCLNPTRTGFIDILRRMGASIETRVRRREPEPVGTIAVETGSLRGVTVASNEVPLVIDELPLLAVLATRAEGETEVRGAHELRLKESDRIDSISAVLRRMGAEIRTFDDGFAIRGPQELRGAPIDAFGDHRIAMAGAVAALGAEGETVITGAECVGISYPGFFATLRSLGGTAR